MLPGWIGDGGRPVAVKQRKKHPNILFLMTDQQRYDCISANGNPFIRTPHLDALAAQSANFSHAIVQAPVCVPSRVCFFTGRYAHAHRNRVNYTPLDERESLLPQLLQAAGYHTALIGKSHVYYQYPPSVREAHRTGFDHVEVHDGAGNTDQYSDYMKWRRKRDPDHTVSHRATITTSEKSRAPRRNPFTARVKEEFSETTWTGLRTSAYLRRRKTDKQPFFLFSSFWKPHSPFEVPEPFASMYNDVDIPLPPQARLSDIRRLPPPVQALVGREKTAPWKMTREEVLWMYRSYYGSITHIDREVGRILHTLQETGLADDTIVIFASDHGDQMFEHGLVDKNVFYEASVRVPLMIAYPGKTHPGRYDELIESIDLLPTLCEWAHINEPYHCQGRSLAPLISGNRRAYQPKESVFCENIIPEVFLKDHIRFQKHAGVAGVRHPDAKMVRTKRWKYVYYPDGWSELFDLEADPSELNNLSSSSRHRSIIQEMQSRLLHWLVTSSETEQIAETWML